MRLPQLAPVWALGLTKRELARLELLRALLLAALTFVVAIPVGLLLAWVLLAVINVEAFGWRLPMFLFPREWVWLGRPRCSSRRGWRASGPRAGSRAWPPRHCSRCSPMNARENLVLAARGRRDPRGGF
jgi:putative ABC transport system permease protein